MTTTEAPSTQAAPAKPAALGAATMCEAFQTTAAERGDQVALRAFGSEATLTWTRYAERVRSIAAGLHGCGVRAGDTVALLMTNRPEFFLVDMAAVHLGAVPFSVYATFSPDQIAHLLTNAEARVVVVDEALTGVVKQARASAPGVERVFTAERLAELEAVEPGEGFDFDAGWRAVGPDDVLTLIYTSGTTGHPKGVQLTHANMMAEVRMADAVLPATPGGRATSYLPSAHIADRWLAYYHASTVFGADTTCIADIKQVAAALPGVRPTIWGAVPRVWEKIMAALQAGGITDPSVLGEETKAAVRAKIGLDRVEWLVSGAAAIPGDVLRFFLDLGLPICELWGMSEVSCCAVVNPPDDIRIGTVGKALPGIELSLLDDGELLLRGATVMKGYRNDPERTAEVLDADGWLHTGDVATIDDDGYVTIVDRKKELIINAGGKNMSPANIEQELKVSSGLIGQAVCIGDDRRYNVALLTIDPDAAAKFAADHGCSADPAELREREDVQQEIARGVEAANAKLSRVEQIKRYTVLEFDWLPGGDELTPTMKLKRRPIDAKYAERIEALYAEA